MMHTIKTTVAFLLLHVLSSLPCTEAATIFRTNVPTACVHDYLGPAGFCALQMGCQERCFNDAPSSGNAADVLSFESDPLQNFYIPVDAVECDQLEEPICPVTSCCPACKEELEDLFRCMINEGGHHYIYYLAGSCPLDCAAPTAAPIRPLPTAFPTPLPTAAPAPITTTNATTVPLPSTSGPDAGIDPIGSVDSNFTGYNITNCTVVDMEVVCTTYFINGTGYINGTFVNGTMVNGTMVNATMDNSTSIEDDPVGINNDPVENGASNAIDPTSEENAPIRGPITIVSTNDSVTMIDSHHNTTIVYDNSPTGTPPVASGIITTTTTGNEPQDNQEEVSEPASVPIESTAEVEVIESDDGKHIVLIVSNVDSITIVDTHHNTTTIVTTHSP